MRLIDADKLKKDMLFQNILGESTQKIIDRYIHIVNSQPTAFDIEKTVKELDEKSFFVATSKEFYNNSKNGEYAENVVSLADAIKIVRAEVELYEGNSFQGKAER